ncbi:DegV family protein [Brevibacillus daliensis]|uniref:DegV family protein n=1 Tax=Brevibacillus daliensis TaxID=2892995 RepID=UPI001E336A2F|nr:DegV family protein [Brevibacillus daliensis]
MTSSIVIVTDSASDINTSIATEQGIEIVPLKVSFGEEAFIDGVTMLPEEFFKRIQTAEEMPKTSQPSPAEFAAKFKEIIDKHGSDVCIIAIMLSSKLSGTYQSAVIGKSLLEEEADITIIDSKKGSYFQALFVMEAVKMVRNGFTKHQILDEIDRMIHTMREFMILDSLEYLHKGGRLGKASAMIGSLLNIKLVLSLDETGAVYAFDKVRGKKKALARMMDEFREYAQDAKIKVTIMHANALDEAKALKERLQEEFHVIETYVSEIGSVIGTYSGPGAICCGMVRAE